MDFTVRDFSSSFTVGDIVLVFVLSFTLSTVIGLVYRQSHHGIGYSRSYVQTLVVLGMVISLIMLVVGSNIARAFALVGALSVIRFRNAIKETRDVGIIFLVMSIGMAVGTRFYLLATVATVVISAVVWLMYRFNWFVLSNQRQVVKVHVPPDEDYTDDVREVLEQYTTDHEFVAMESIRGGALTQLTYTVRLAPTANPGELITALRERASGQYVTVLASIEAAE
jgi:uncharacterized membrane protein YhiD involved in acid resistance